MSCKKKKRKKQKLSARQAQAVISQRILVGFDFYGAGNIGDDLMLDGFLSSVTEVNVSLLCAIPRAHMRSQKKRFPRVEWIQCKPGERAELIRSCDAWLGIGGTPFQITSGPWMLNFLVNELEKCSLYHKPAYMVGVGAEAEIAHVPPEIFKYCLANMRKVWFRDSHSLKVLEDNLEDKADNQKLCVGADLANISLARIFGNNRTGYAPRNKVAVCFYTEQENPQNFEVINRFAEKLHNKGNEVVFFANETRTQGSFEHYIYTNFLDHRYIRYYTPDYQQEDLESLVNHYLEYDTVLASRYHAILAAAWAGSRVVALGRSSKIFFIAQELEIPLVERPLGIDRLESAFEYARRLDVAKLRYLSSRALKSVQELMEEIARSNLGKKVT